MDDEPERHETAAERADRNFGELMQELRVLQTGVTILLGFLLAVAIEPRFQELSDLNRGIYSVTFLLCCTATALLMAPVAYHRTLFAQGRKAEIVRVTNRFTIVGMAVLCLTILGVALLVLNLVFDNVIAVAMTAALTLITGILWYAFPLSRRRR